MKPFREYLVENDYPGAYYTQDMRRMVAHFNSREEKEEFDADPRNDPNDELIFRSDKRAKSQLNRKKVATSAASNIASNYLQPIANTALKAALGNGLLSEVPIEHIANNVNKLREELSRVNSLLQQIQAEYAKSQDPEVKKQLKERYEHYRNRKTELSNAYKRYQDANYV